jgi:regulator of protease activity HflC (stomatin/prohibitin superfamily)
MLRQIAKPKTVNSVVALIRHNPIRNMSLERVVPRQDGIEGMIGGLVNILASPFHLIGSGFFTVKPQYVCVTTYFGKYIGHKFTSGLNWTPTPIGTTFHQVFVGAESISMKNSKIIDANGNPVVVSGVMNYYIDTPEQYLFGIDSPKYIYNQAEKTLKKVVSQYPYDELKKEGDNIQQELTEQAQKQLEIAGVKVMDFNLTDMNYSTEIAQAMLVKQQAGAYIEARKDITKAACDIVNDAVSQYDMVLSSKDKAELIKNLLVVITSNSNVQPVINVSNRTE